MELKRGMRGSLSDIINVNDQIIVTMTVTGSAVYDHTCFGVDEMNKLSDDRYMIFYNQTVSPNNEIRYDMSGNTSRFIITLGKLPASINKLVFTINIDGTQTMGTMLSTEFRLFQNNKNAIDMVLTGKDFKSEKAVILIELYKKNGIWRYNCVASGFNGGLSDLLRYYGGTEATSDNAKQNAPVNSSANVQTNNISNSIPTPTATSFKPQNSGPSVGGFSNVNSQTMTHNTNNIPTQTFGNYVPTPVKSPGVSVSSTTSPIQVKAPQKNEKISLKKGQKISLTKSESAYVRIENGWTAKGKDYDLKALVRYRNGKLIYIGAANDDESISTPDGAVKHGGDIKNPGELEHIDIKWHSDIASIAVSSYSALENGTGSFREYGVYVRIINGNQIIEIPAEDTSADENSYTLCFGEILFGTEKDSIEVSALEMYSRPHSEHRIGYKGAKVCMDIGPEGETK